MALPALGERCRETGAPQARGDERSCAVRLLVDELKAGYKSGPDVLNGVSFEIGTGDFVAILGANGAGKTTLVRALTGLIGHHRGAVRGGRMTHDGRSLGSDPATIVRAGICHVPEGRQVFARLSVADNLRLGASTRRDRSRIDRDLAQYFERFPVLGKRRGDAAGLLSGGEQQLLAITRALMAQPQVLIVDELSLGLAPLIVESMFSLVAEVNGAGTSAIVIEQNARVALRYVERAYVLQGGSIIAEGGAAELANDARVASAYFGSVGEKA
jgi:branched-chain amino acid transport system ATP-binding protein